MFTAIIRGCPAQYSEWIGQPCLAAIDDKLTLMGEKNGIKTSPVRSHEQDGRRHTVITASGNRYVFDCVGDTKITSKNIDEVVVK